MKLVAVSLNNIIETLRQIVVSKYPEYISEKAQQRKIREEFLKIVSKQVSFGPNSDMLSYLKEAAITTELSHQSRNFIIVDEEVSDDKFEILGFFTLALKIINVNYLDQTTRKSFVLSGKSAANIDSIPGILIAQFGKNLHFNKISGSQVMELVIEKIQQAQSVLGGKMVYLDSVNHEKVIDFYEQFGFVKYGELIEDKHQLDIFYQPMALDMTKISNI